MSGTKRVILTLSEITYAELSKQAQNLGLTIPAYIRYLLTKRTEELKEEESV